MDVEGSVKEGYGDLSFAAETKEGRKTYKLTGDRDAFRVIATVGEFLLETMKRVDGVAFTGDEGRAATYKMFIKRLRKMGFKTDVVPLSSLYRYSSERGDAFFVARTKPGLDGVKSWFGVVS